MDRMEDGRRDRLWAVRAPEQGEVTHNQKCRESFLKVVAFGLWHKGSVGSFFPIHFVLSTRAHFFRLSRFLGEQTPPPTERREAVGHLAEADL